jgi:hypothetical protein
MAELVEHVEHRCLRLIALLRSPVDGSPQVVRFDATTLWHLDAAEWVPVTVPAWSPERGTPTQAKIKILMAAGSLSLSSMILIRRSPM